MSNKLPEVNDLSFQTEVVQSTLPTLVDFWAPWCGPCRMVTPLLEELSVEYAGKVKIVSLNTDSSPMTSMNFNIRSIPTLMLFKNGEAVDTRVGAYPKRELQKFIEQNLE